MFLGGKKVLIYFFHQNLIWGIKNAELDADFKFVDMGSEKCSEK
jgi:hypothetical protein